MYIIIYNSGLITKSNTLPTTLINNEPVEEIINLTTMETLDTKNDNWIAIPDDDDNDYEHEILTLKTTISNLERKVSKFEQRLKGTGIKLTYK